MPESLRDRLQQLRETAEKAEWRGGELPHGEHPRDYGYGYTELPPEVVVALVETAEAGPAPSFMRDMAEMCRRADPPMPATAAICEELANAREDALARLDDTLSGRGVV